MGTNPFVKPEKYSTPIGFRKDGRPIYLMAGGSVDSLENPVPGETAPNPTPGAAPVQHGDEVFTKADLEAAIENARKQEKDKVYGRLNTLQEQLAEVNRREQERQQAEEAARAKAEEEARRKEEENLSAKELLARKEQEWQERLNSTTQTFEQKMAQIQAEREQERALLEKDRELAALQAFTQRRLAEEADSIAPQLVDFIRGNSQEEIEQSIAVAKAKSQEIVQAVQAANTAARSQQRGVSSTGYAPVGPMEIEGGNRQYSAEDIRNMDVAEYAKFRQQIPGLGGASNNRGLFG